MTDMDLNGATATICACLLYLLQAIHAPQTDPKTVAN